MFTGNRFCTIPRSYKNENSNLIDTEGAGKSRAGRGLGGRRELLKSWLLIGLGIGHVFSVFNSSIIVLNHRSPFLAGLKRTLISYFDVWDQKLLLCLSYAVTDDSAQCALGALSRPLLFTPSCSPSTLNFSVLRQTYADDVILPHLSYLTSLFS